MTMTNKFVVAITNTHNDTDKCTVGFVIANAALGSDRDTVAFLSTDGVWAAVKGEAEKINEGEPFAPLKELVDKFQENGGKIMACAPCLKKRGISEDQLLPGTEIVGGATLVEMLVEGAPCVTY